MNNSPAPSNESPSLSLSQFSTSAGEITPESHGVLLWKMNGADDFQLSRDLIPSTNIETVSSRTQFTFNMVQRKHLFAVVVTDHPFTDETRLLRRFINQLEGAIPVVLLLADCPYPSMNVEKDFEAVGNLNDSLSDLREMFQNAAARGIAHRDRLAAAVDDSMSTDNDPTTHSILNARRQLKEQLQTASKQTVTTLTGEVGTARTLFSKLLLQTRSGTGPFNNDRRGNSLRERDCMTFYAGAGDDRIVASIREMLGRKHKPQTFIVCDPSPNEAVQLADIFASISSVEDESSQLIMHCDSTAAEFDKDSIHLAPLREQQRIIPEIIAGVLTTLANRWPEIRVSITPQAVQLMSKCRWPGNICQLNLALAASLLDGMEQRRDADESVAISAETIRILMPEQSASQQMPRTWLRDRLSSVCEWFSERGYGSPAVVRTVLNETLLQNAGLAWNCERGAQQDQPNQIRRAA